MDTEDFIPEEYERGKTEANSDIRRGSPQMFWGTRGAWGEFMTRLMAERFSVSVEHTDCFVWPEIVSYRRGYNDAIEAHIDQKFGAGSFQAAMEEVEKFRRDRYNAFF